MAFGFSAPKTAKAPTGMGDTHKPGFWTILDGVLGGSTISEAAYEARAREASLAGMSQKTALRQRLADAIAAATGEDGGEASPAATPRMAGPGLDGEPVSSGQPAEAAPLPALPKRRKGLNADDLATPFALAALGGDADASKAFEILNKSRPSIKIGPDGQAYNENDPANLDRRFGNPTVVNSRVTDINDQKNLDQYIAEPPVKGAVPVYGPEGKAAAPVGWKMPDGALQAISSTEAATSGGRAAGAAPFQIVTIQMPDGSAEQMTLDAFRSQRGQPPGGEAGGANIGRSQTPADAEYAKRQAGAAQARFQKVQADGAAAPTKIANLQQIGALLDGVEGGKLAPLGLDIAQAANSLGFKIDSKLGNKEAANALSQQIALSFKDQLPGPLSNADRTFLVQMAPGLSQSAQGRKLMIDSATKVYQRQADVAKMARAWETKYGRLDAKNPATRKGFDDNLQIWVERNKLFPQARK